MTANGIYTNEAVLESKQVMRSRAFHVKTDGSIAHSLATDTVEFLFGAMTGDPVEPESVDSTITKEAYQETGHFHGNGKDYDLNVIFQAIEDEDIPVKSVPISRLTWVLKYDTPLKDRVAKADITVPIIVVYHDGRYLVVDGLHRLAKARLARNTQIDAYVISKKLFESSEIKNSAAKESVSDLSVAREGLPSAMTLPVDVSKLDKAYMAQLEQHPELLQALYDWLKTPDRKLLPQLQQLAELGRKLRPYPKQFKVFRGFYNSIDYQEKMGWNASMGLGHVYTFKSDTVVVSTSLVPDISRAFGGNVMEIDIDTRKHNVLIVTDEMYAAATKQQNFKKVETQFEVIMLPKIDVQVRVVELDKAYALAEVFNYFVSGVKEVVKNYLGKKPGQEYFDNLTGKDMSIIYLGEDQYSPQVLYKNINKHDQMPERIAISDIGYARTNMRVPQEKIDAAKVNSSILVERIELEDGKVRYHAIYGFDILIKARQQGETQVNAHVISKADLEAAKIVPEAA